jgi:regulator of sigma E protease
MEFLVKVGQLLLSLSLLIVLHELGHFLPARWFKTRVEKFYLFFDFAPFNSLWKIQRGETEYGIGWLPLGGYVKISGMVDESMDTEALKQPPQPWEFRSKPAWQRLIIMIGGVTVNFILGFLIFGLSLWYWGKPSMKTSELRDGIAYDSLLLRQGFRQGDLITHIGDKPFERFEPGQFMRALVLNNEQNITVLRDGQPQQIKLSADIARQVTNQRGLLSPRVPFVIGQVAPNSPAEQGHLQKGDQIIALNGQPTLFYDQFGPLARQNRCQAVTITTLRGPNRDTVLAKITISKEGTIGVYAKTDGYFNLERKTYTLAEAMPAGVRMGMDFLNTQISAFGQMFRGKIKASDSLGSFISIGNTFPYPFDAEIFWTLTASLSILLAFMNLLPIPALDGGYVLFLIWEVVTGRRVSDKFMERAVTVGFFLMMGLMVYALGLDMWRFVFSRFFGGAAAPVADC